MDAQNKKTHYLAKKAKYTVFHNTDTKLLKLSNSRMTFQENSAPLTKTIYHFSLAVLLNNSMKQRQLINKLRQNTKILFLTI